MRTIVAFIMQSVRKDKHFFANIEEKTDVLSHFTNKKMYICTVFIN